MPGNELRDELQTSYGISLSEDGFEKCLKSISEKGKTINARNLHEVVVNQSLKGIGEGNFPIDPKTTNKLTGLRLFQI